MPLARVALYEKGITLYISPNTNDNPEWFNTICHIAIEGHCYFINCNMYFTRDMYPADLHCPEEISRLPEVVCRGGSCIIDPYGHYVTEPVWDEESLIIADLDMTLPAACKMEHDAVGHYARPDVLELIVHE
jgi:nitrilase